MKKNSTWTYFYILTDFLSAALEWVLLFIYRKQYLEPQKFGVEVPIKIDNNFYLGLIIIPTMWVIGYYLTGSYKDIFRKHRLKELSNTLWQSIFVNVLRFSGAQFI